MQNMNERIKEIRKKLGYSQKDFGEKLGVSRSVIVNVELGRLARPDQKETLYKLICKTFGVNEQWLRSGEGSMFMDEELCELCDLSDRYGLSDVEMKIIKAYIDLPEDTREAIFDFIKAVATETNSSTEEEKKKIYETEDA